MWTTPESYSQIIAGKFPDKYWLIKPTDSPAVEIDVPFQVVTEWNQKVSKKQKQMLFG